MTEYVFDEGDVGQEGYGQVAEDVTRELEAHGLSFDVAQEGKHILYRGRHFTGCLYQDGKEPGQQDIVATFSGDGCQESIERALEQAGFA